MGRSTLWQGPLEISQKGGRLRGAREQICISLPLWLSLALGALHLKGQEGSWTCTIHSTRSFFPAQVFMLLVQCKAAGSALGGKPGRSTSCLRPCGQGQYCFPTSASVLSWETSLACVESQAPRLFCSLALCWDWPKPGWEQWVLIARDACCRAMPEHRAVANSLALLPWAGDELGTWCQSPWSVTSSMAHPSPFHWPHLGRSSQRPGGEGG